MIDPDQHLLLDIAFLAHCGGIEGFSESETLARIRRLTRPYFNDPEVQTRLNLHHHYRTPHGTL